MVSSVPRDNADLQSGGRRFNPGLTNTQSLYVTEEKVLPLR